jgi:hypothetical protein
MRRGLTSTGLSRIRRRRTPSGSQNPCAAPATPKPRSPTRRDSGAHQSPHQCLGARRGWIWAARKPRVRLSLSRVTGRRTLQRQRGTTPPRPTWLRKALSGVARELIEGRTSVVCSRPTHPSGAPTSGGAKRPLSSTSWRANGGRHRTTVPPRPLTRCPSGSAANHRPFLPSGLVRRFTMGSDHVLCGGPPRSRTQRFGINTSHHANDALLLHMPRTPPSDPPRIPAVPRLR